MTKASKRNAKPTPPPAKPVAAGKSIPAKPVAAKPTAAKSIPVAKPVSAPAKAAKANGAKSTSKPAAVPTTKAPKGRPAPVLESAKEILRRAKPHKFDARVDAPVPLKGKAKAAAARKPGTVAFDTRRDAPMPLEQHASKLLRQLRDEQKEFHPSEGKGTFDGGKFNEFFSAEIETEVTRPAEIVHDRIARWRCQCCDALIPVPRRTTVYHGDYILEHDDVLGLLVNGERWVPKAETPLEVVQPGRLKDPWSGELLKGGKRSV